MRRVIFSIFTLTIFSLASFGQNVAIFPFYNQTDEDIASASIGVLKSVIQYIKYLPGININESSFDVKNRNIQEIIKIFPGYDNYIIGSYQKNKETFTFSITIYDNKGIEIKKFQTSSEDLLEVADNITKEISSFYSRQSVGFATLNIVSKLPEERTFTAILNDQILFSTKDKKDLSIKIISKIPHTIIVRDDQTKEVIFNKTITLLDNESMNLEITLPQSINIQKTNSLEKVETTPKRKIPTISKAELALKIEKLIKEQKIFNETLRKPLKEDLKLLDRATKELIFRKYELPLYLTIIGTAVNVIIPGLGSGIIGDSSGLTIALISPWITSIITVGLQNQEDQRLKGLQVAFGVITILGYAYNLIRPTLYTIYWNNTLKEFLLTQNLSISTEGPKISFNIKF
ncbi:MAG: hypothetical protein ACP5KI_00600 [Brevinematia bacterium]